MACGTTNSVSIKVEPMRVFWGREHCRDYLSTEANGAGAAGNWIGVNYFNGDYEEVLGYIWFNSGASSDPAPSGRTEIAEVAILAGDTNAQVVAKLIAALDGNEFINVNEGDTNVSFCIQNRFIGEISTEAAGDFLATKTVEIEGIGGDLGATQGGAELAFEAQTFELKSDQTGELVLGDIYLGSSASASFNLIELTAGTLKAVIAGVTGDSHTPASGTELIGYGQSKLYQSLINSAGKLILHPVRIPDLTDRSSDWVFWKSAPLPESVNFSGTENQAMSVSFKAYLDRSKEEAINLFCQGDWSQLV